MVLSQARAEEGRLVEHVRVQLDPPEAGGGCVQGGLGEPDPGPVGDRLGRHTEHGFRDQQVVGEVEILRQTSAGEPLEDLAIALHHGAQALAKGLVLPLALDVVGDRLPDRVGNADPFRARDRFQLVRLGGGQAERHQ